MKDTLGGKGASLAAMARAGLPVPPGFTIEADCCRHFREHGGKWPDGLHEQVREHVARLEKETGRLFGKGPRPLLVAVRSGAAVSMPGMMDTLLNCGVHPGLQEELGESKELGQVLGQFIVAFAVTVKGLDRRLFPVGSGEDSTRESLAVYERETGEPFPSDPWRLLRECIDGVFRSWESKRALAYRERHGIHGLPGTAVNVQAMWPSHVSGIVFTRDPARPHNGNLVVESAYGLGESIVSGEVSPDRFVVSRDDFTQVAETIGAKSSWIRALGDAEVFDTRAPSLSRVRLGELCELALRVEEQFGQPMDIEWGLADGRLALLQCRPIRGLAIHEEAERLRLAEIERLRRLADGRRRIWVAHNLGETLPLPKPLSWSVIRAFMSGSGGFGLMYRDFGYRPSETVLEGGFLERICGRIYTDPERQALLFWEALPLVYDLESVAKDPSLLEGPPTRFDPEKADGKFLLKLPGIVSALIRGSRRIRRARRNAREIYEREVLPPYLEYVRTRSRMPLERLSTKELVGEFEDRCRRVLDEFGKESLKPGFFGGLALSSLQGLLVQLLGKEEGTRLVSDLTSGLEGDTTLQQDVLLWKVAHGEASLEEFIREYGHRAAGELELAEPRWREDLCQVNRLLEQIRAGSGRSPLETHAASAERRCACESSLPETLAREGGSSFLEEVRAHLAEARVLLPYRESGKQALMMGYELLRRVCLELGRRWNIGDDVFFLERDELDRFEHDRDGLASLIEQRKVQWQASRRLHLPDVIDSRNLDDLGLPPETETDGELEGLAVSTGVATGPVRIVHDPRECGELGSGYVLVCPSTDPGWTPLFVHAAGLVVERGGLLSHGAIVARDFGIPAVVLPGATTRLPPGSKVRLDGNRGRILVVEA
jgi:pyruvate,water dikinase